MTPASRKCSDRCLPSMGLTPICPATLPSKTASTSNSHVTMEVVPEVEPVAVTGGMAMAAEADGARVALVDMALEGLADQGVRGDRGAQGDQVMVALPSVMMTMIPDPSANRTTIQSSKGGQLHITSRTSKLPSGRASHS